MPFMFIVFLGNKLPINHLQMPTSGRRPQLVKLCDSDSATLTAVKALVNKGANVLQADEVSHG